MKVRRLDVPSTTSQVFGTVLHGVIERYLMGDDLGRDANGFPINLYPPGWHKAQARFAHESDKADGEIDPMEQDLIRRLVSKAIEEGVIERLPGRKIEGGFKRTMEKLPCPKCNGRGEICEPSIGVEDIVEEVEKCPKCGGDGKGVTIGMTGFIDVEFRDAIQDHKSTKSMKYAKSANKLKENSQMLIYAYIIVQKAKERGEPLPTTIELRHNVFSKEGKVRKTVAHVTIQEVENHWHRVMEDAKEMVKLRDRTEVFHEIGEPQNLSEACNAYGGCPFRTLCSGQETEAQYETRMKYVAEHQGEQEAFKKKLFENVEKGLDASSSDVSLTQVNNAPSAQKGISKMSGFAEAMAKRRAQNAAVAGAPATPALQGVVPPTINVPPPAAPIVAAPVAAPVVAQNLTPVNVPMPAPVVMVASAPAGCVPPPWAQKSCPACVGSGFNSQGKPCRICDNKAKNANQLTSQDFIIENLGDGKVLWINRTNDTHAGESFLGGNVAPAPVRAEVREAPAPVAPQITAPAPAPVAQPATMPVSVPVATPVLPPAPVVAPVAASPVAPQPATTPAATEESAEKKKMGRPVKSFILVKNGVVAKGAERIGSGRGVIRLDDVLSKFGDELAKNNGVGSYYELDAFKRRDQIASVARIIAEELGTDIVICTGIGTGASDLKNLFDALRPFAGMEIVAEAN